MITVHDETGTLTAEAQHDLTATPTPFAATIVFRDVAKPEMESAMRACGSASPTAVCIGVSPRGHFSATYYGIDVAGPAAAETIKKAGNPSFKAGDWAQGAKDILVRAEAVSHSRAGVAVINQPVTTIENPVSAVPFVIGFGFLGTFVLLAYVAIRRQRAAMKEAIENSQRETAEMASRNIRADDAPARPATPTPRQRHETAVPHRRHVRAERPPIQSTPIAPAPVVMYRGIDDNLAAGILLGQAMSQPRVVEHEIIREEPRHRVSTPAPSRSYDSDSSSSSFSDSSSGGGSSDFGDSGGGGGSSDW